jgi:hypothetical protein
MHRELVEQAMAGDHDAFADGTNPYLVEGVTVDPYTRLEWAPDGTRLIAIDSLETNDEEPSLIIIDPTGSSRRSDSWLAAVGAGSGWRWTIRARVPLQAPRGACQPAGPEPGSWPLGPRRE